MVAAHLPEVLIVLHPTPSLSESSDWLPRVAGIFHVIASVNKNRYLKLDTFPIISYIIHSVVYFSCVLVILFFLITECADLCTQHAESPQCVTLNFGSDWMQPLIHAKVNSIVTSNADKISC